MIVAVVEAGKYQSRVMDHHQILGHGWELYYSKLKTETDLNGFSLSHLVSANPKLWKSGLMSIARTLFLALEFDMCAGEGDFGARSFMKLLDDLVWLSVLTSEPVPPGGSEGLRLLELRCAESLAGWRVNLDNGKTDHGVCRLSGSAIPGNAVCIRSALSLVSDWKPWILDWNEVLTPMGTLTPHSWLEAGPFSVDRVGIVILIFGGLCRGELQHLWEREDSFARWPKASRKLSQLSFWWQNTIILPRFSGSIFGWLGFQHNNYDYKCQ